MYLKVFVSFSNFSVLKLGRYHLNKEIKVDNTSNKLHGHRVPFYVFDLTQATFPHKEATICFPSPFAMLSLLDSQLPEPTFYLLAFYVWPSLCSCME